MSEEMKQDLERQRLEFERQKHQAEHDLKQQEFELQRERQRHETQLREEQERRARWQNPLVLAVAAAFLGLMSNAVVTLLNGQSQQELEDKRSEAARVLEIIKTGDPDLAAENLDFLLKLRLIKDPDSAISKYLREREKGEGPWLPVPSGTTTIRDGIFPLESSTDTAYCGLYLRYGVPSRNDLTFCRIGYAFSFNKERKQADWVIYRLAANQPNPRKERGVDRFYLDRDIPSELQVGDSVYRENDFDRGHLIRRSDATWNDKAYEEIWLFSVTAPQHQDLNQDLWLKLEELTSHAASTGTVEEIFIISGPIYGPKTIKNYRGAVDIPDGFYRIVFDPTHNRVAAWVVPNGPIGDDIYPGRENAIDDIDRYTISIDRIEELTGFDFLNNLPDDTEKAIEGVAQDPSWLR